MLRLDLLNKKYTVKEIIDILIDNDIKNIKYDYDFLGFILSYCAGKKYLIEPKYQKYAKYDGMLNIMKLDELGFLGNKLYKIYEICDKDKIKFIKTCDLIGLYGFLPRIDKKLIDINLKLKKPVSFCDDSIKLHNGKSVKYDESKDIFDRFNLKSKFDFDEYVYEINRSLRKRINESIRENKDDISLLNELPTYKEYQNKKALLATKRMFSDSYLYDVNNVCYGNLKYKMHDFAKETLDLKDWFYDTNIDFFNYHVIQTIPLGDYYFIGKDNKAYTFEEIIRTEKVFCDFDRIPTIYDINKIYELGISKLEEDYENNEDSILYIKSSFENFLFKDSVNINEIDDINGVTQELFDIIYEDDNKGNNKKYNK